MRRRGLVSAILFAAVTSGASGIGAAQTYPHKPIRMLAPEAGGSNDLVARVLAKALAVNLGQPVIVENRGSAGGIIAAQLLARAAPDAHTILFYSSGIWTTPVLQGNASYDVTRDFAPITSAASSP